MSRTTTLPKMLAVRLALADFVKLRSLAAAADCAPSALLRALIRAARPVDCPRHQAPFNLAGSALLDHVGQVEESLRGLKAAIEAAVLDEPGGHTSAPLTTDLPQCSEGHAPASLEGVR
jgi:hypothetical protein